MDALPKEVIRSDILIIGGGPAGLSAAIRAADLGVKNIVVADKGNPIRSGNAASGNDHFMCYIPEYHGHDIKPVLRELSHYPFFWNWDRSYAQIWLDRSFEMVKIWDSWGIPMKYNGRWEFAGHAYPDRPRLFLKYAGGNQKPVLTEQAVKRSVDIKKRVTVFELLKDEEKVTGAIGYDTWQGKIIEFHAKCVFLGTGGCNRLYKGSTSLMFNLPNTPYGTGDGRAMALRIGADLFNLEMTQVWAGPKYFARCGKATWIGVYRDPSGNPVGPFINRPNIEYGDVIADAFPSLFDEYMRSGKGPVYNDCKGATNEEMKYMIHWLRNEGYEALIRYLERENIDPREHPVEFRTYEPFVAGGIWFSNNSQTSVKGLYAAGDEYFGGMANAVVWGRIAGETMARDLKAMSLGDPSRTKEESKAKVDMVQNILNRKEGPDWEEANIAVQEIMHDYVASVRSESLLQQADTNLRRLKEKCYQSLKANNGHELGRCLEVLNLIDVGEAVIFAAQERKETRGTHRRSDYPFSNPLLDMQLLVTKKDGKLVRQWKELKA